METHKQILLVLWYAALGVHLKMDLTFLLRPKDVDSWFGLD